MVPDSSAEVLCQIQGPAHLVGMDSGDLEDLSVYSSPQRKMLAGRLLAVVCADALGDVTVTFRSDGLLEKKVFLKVVPYTSEGMQHNRSI